MSDSAARATRYRNKAEGVLAIATSMKDALARQVLMGVADDYIVLAEMMERAHAAEPSMHATELTTEAAR